MTYVVSIVAALGLVLFVRYFWPLGPQRIVIERRHFNLALEEGTRGWFHSYSMTPDWLSSRGMRLEEDGAIMSGKQKCGHRFAEVFDDYQAALAYMETAESWKFAGDRRVILMWAVRGWSAYSARRQALSARGLLLRAGPPFDDLTEA